ncbi:MAG: DJ-1/PfpI family protein [Lachnospiraceae bacterium]|nr:DJ-1/PfpI family protein [Lachnospiraceae bacterium]
MQKKTAVLIYDSFCNFEISVALEILALSGKEIVVFGKCKDPICSEEGLQILPDNTIDELLIEEFDSLILPGAADIREAIEDEYIIEFIRKFKDKIVGAISIAPILLVKAGLLKGKSFLAGVNKEEILEEGFSEDDLAKMIGWDDNLRTPIEEGYIISGNMITSVSYNFVRWALGFGKLLGIEIPSENFGVK